MPARRLLLLAALALAAPATAHAAGPGSTLLIDRPSGLGALPFDGAGHAYAGSQTLLSDDGRFAVFESDADQLLPPGADPADRHVFVRDRLANTTTLVATDAGGVPANDGAFNPSISTDGTKVAFLSAATNLTADTVTGFNLYVKSLTTGVVELASRGPGAGGAVANDAREPSLDADGSRVVFGTEAKLDAADDLNTTNDVYVRDLDADTTTLVSRQDGAGGDAVGSPYSARPAISGDGLVAAFDTVATPDPTATDANGKRDVYTRAGTATRLVSRINGAGTAAGNEESATPSLSANGAAVAFVSRASDLVGFDGNGETDVFVRAGTTTALLSRADGGGTLSNGDSYGPVISPDGSRVGFASAATNLVPGTATAAYRTYVRTTGATSTVLASRADGAGGSPIPGTGPSLSTDGTKVLFATSDPAAGGAGEGIAEVAVRDTGAGTTGVVSIASGTTVRHAEVRDAGLGVSSVSDDGRYVVFASESDGLGLQAPVAHVFLRDTATNTTTRISEAGMPSDGFSPAISGDGSTVVYAAGPAPVLRRGVAPGTTVRAYTVATGTTTIVSRGTGAAGVLSNGAAYSPVVNRDGTKVAFVTTATNLDTVNDGDAEEDVYVRDLAATTTTLVSRKDGVGTPSGKDRSSAPSIDAEGRRVAFSSLAKSLAPGDDALGSGDVFVRDVVAGTTTLVSRKDGVGTAAGNDHSRDAAISGDGTRVAFGSTATDLSGDDASGDADVYLRDLAAGTTRLLSRVGASGPSADANAYLEHLSRDGTTVAYATEAPNVLGAAAGRELVVVRTIADGSTVVGSRGDGADGPLPTSVSSASLSADGGCLVFRARGTGLVPGGYPSPDYAHVYLRVLRGECPPAGPAAPMPPQGPGAPQQPQQPQPPQQTPPQADRTAPVISAATVSPRTFAVAPAARAAQRRRAPRGTTVRFTLSEPASVVLTAARRERGRRSGRRCVKSTAALRKRKARGCTRYVAKGTVRVAGKAGANRLAYTGRIGRRALPRGSFRLLVDATDAARNTARTRTLTFTIVRR